MLPDRSFAPVHRVGIEPTGAAFTWEAKSAPQLQKIDGKIDQNWGL